MDRQRNYSGFEEAMELINNQGTDGMGSVIQILMNQAILVERERHLNTRPYERSFWCFKNINEILTP